MQTGEIQLKNNDTHPAHSGPWKNNEQIYRSPPCPPVPPPLEAAASWLNHENAFCLPAAKHIEPKHVYALSRLVNKETQSIRQLMGVTKVSHTLLQVANAEPREVYFQAVNLYGKISRLHHNLTARSILDHNLPPVEQNIRPADVWAVLSVVLIQLDEIKEEYDITTHVQFPEIEEKRVPTDVYQSLLLTIRQVNQMLQEQPYTYSDVYQEISTALYCALNIYNRFPACRCTASRHSSPEKRLKMSLPSSSKHTRRPGISC